MKDEEREIRRVFWENFAAAAEAHLGIGRDERGFMREIKNSLKLPKDSVPQRWFQGALPRVPYLIRIYRTWGITPNELLGIESPVNETSSKLHTLFSAMEMRKRKHKDLRN